MPTYTDTVFRPFLHFVHRTHLALAIVLGITLGITHWAHAAHERLVIGDKVQFILQTTRGTLRSGDLKGVTYAILFWNTRSKKFAAALPELRALAKRLRPQKFALIGYSLDTSVNKSHQYIKNQKLTWLQALAQDQPFPFYDLFYRKRSPVPGVFLVSDTGHLLWFGPLSHLAQQAQDALPPLDFTQPSHLRAARAAAQAAYRATLRMPPDTKRLFEHLSIIPDTRWSQDLQIKQTLGRIARRLAHLNNKDQAFLEQAAAQNDHHRALLQHLRALQPKRIAPPAAESPHAFASPLAPTPLSIPEEDLSLPAQTALAQARKAETQNDWLFAWEQYHAAANDPHGAQAADQARDALKRLNAQIDFGQRLVAARRERVASDLYVKALNFLAAERPDAADRTLRQIRRDYYDCPSAQAAERALARLAAMSKQKAHP